jgi:hypothetical protein
MERLETVWERSSALTDFRREGLISPVYTLRWARRRRSVVRILKRQARSSEQRVALRGFLLRCLQQRLQIFHRLWVGQATLVCCMRGAAVLGACIHCSRSNLQLEVGGGQLLPAHPHERVEARVSATSGFVALRPGVHVNEPTGLTYSSMPRSCAILSYSARAAGMRRRHVECRLR